VLHCRKIEFAKAAFSRRLDSTYEVY